MKLPTDGHLLKSIDGNTTSYQQIFPPGQPYKSLYAVHTLLEYIEAAFHGRIDNEDPKDDPTDPGQSSAYTKALKTGISFATQAISDKNVFDQASVSLRLKLTGTLIHAFRRLLDNMLRSTGTLAGSSMVTELYTPGRPVSTDIVIVPEPARLVEILTCAIDSPGDASPVIAGTLALTLRLSIINGAFWAKLNTNPDFVALLHRALLTDPRPGVRSLVVKLIEELVSMTGHTQPLDRSNESSSNNPDDIFVALVSYFWGVVSDLVLQIAGYPDQCEDFFRLTYVLLMRLKARSPGVLDLPRLASQVSQLLLAHTSTEVGSVSFETVWYRLTEYTGHWVFGWRGLICERPRNSSTYLPTT